MVEDGGSDTLGNALDSITRRDIEVVIAQHDEDLTWSAPLASVTTVYTKKEGRPRSAPSGVVAHALPNIGREQHISSLTLCATTTGSRSARRSSTAERRAVDSISPPARHFLLTNVSIVDYLTHPFFSESAVPPDPAARRLPPVYASHRKVQRLSRGSRSAHRLPISHKTTRPTSSCHTARVAVPSGSRGDYWLPWGRRASRRLSEQVQRSRRPCPTRCARSFSRLSAAHRQM